MNKSKIVRKIILILLFATICLGISGLFGIIFITAILEQNEGQRISEPKHSIEKTGNGFELLWEIPNIYTISPSNQSNLTVFEDRVFVVTKDPDVERQNVLSLFAIDAYSGEILWQENAKFRWDMTHNQQYLFVQNNGGISAHDPVSGEQIWYTKPPGVRGIDHMTANDMELFLSTTPDNSFILDSATGVVKNPSLSSGVATSLFLFEEDMIFLQQWPLHLVASDAESSETIWKHSFEGGFEKTPIFTEDMIFVTTFRGQLFALDKKTGEIIWDTKYPESLSDPNRVVSNVAIDDNILYYLTQDAQLQAVNTLNGGVIDQASFTPNLYNLESSLNSYRFDVGGDDGIVAIYFGDSFQLFVFQFQQKD